MEWIKMIQKSSWLEESNPHYSWETQNSTKFF